MDNGTMLHLLRSPWGHPEEDVRQARLAAADALEKWGRCVTHPGSAVEWIAVMQADTAALRARLRQSEICDCGWDEEGVASLCAAHQHVNNESTEKLRARVAEAEAVCNEVKRAYDAAIEQEVSDINTRMRISIVVAAELLMTAVATPDENRDVPSAGPVR